MAELASNVYPILIVPAEKPARAIRALVLLEQLGIHYNKNVYRNSKQFVPLPSPYRQEPATLVLFLQQ
jgi:hypothetical protein